MYSKVGVGSTDVYKSEGHYIGNFFVVSLTKEHLWVIFQKHGITNSYRRTYCGRFWK